MEEPTAQTYDASENGAEMATHHAKERVTKQQYGGVVLGFGAEHEVHHAIVEAA